MNDAVSSPFRKANNYERNLVRKNSVGNNVLFATEALTDLMNIKSGMKVLDLGCGKGLSSIFLAKEFDATVFAVDNFYDASDNLELIKAFGLEGKVVPLNIDAKRLPFPFAYFDCIVSINSFTYFGTDDKYLPYVCRYLRPGGQIGITDICVKKEIEDKADIPGFLKESYANHWFHIHSLNWWKKRWELTELVDISVAEHLKDSALIKQEYINYYPKPSEEAFATALNKDEEEFISFFALVGIRSAKSVFLEEKFK